MSERIREQHRSCPKTGKVQFTSIDQARRANATARFRIRVYRCEWCHKFHATNADKD